MSDNNNVQNEEERHYYEDLPYTNFPVDQEDFILYKNVDNTSKPIVDAYLGYMSRGEFSAAQEYYEQHAAVLNETIINENTINTLLQSIIAIERMFISDIDEYINRSTGNLVPIEVVNSLPSTTEVGKLYLVLES